MNSLAEPLIRLDHISMMRNARYVLDDISLTINKGDFMTITGPNGGGKTTLLRIILGLLHPTRGTVYKPKGLTIGYLPQKNMIDSKFPISVREVVESGLLQERGLSRHELHERADAILHVVGMDTHASQPIGALSGGQLQRTLLGRAIISRPQLLALDEPLSYIDKRFESRLYSLIEEIAANTTILLISHEMSRISGMANRHIIIDGGVHECSAEHHYVHSDCDE